MTVMVCATAVLDQPQSKKIRGEVPKYNSPKLHKRGEIMSKVLTVKDVSAILRISLRETYELMNSNAFPSYRIRNKHFITEEALDNWLKKIENKTIVM